MVSDLNEARAQACEARAGIDPKQRFYNRLLYSWIVVWVIVAAVAASQVIPIMTNGQGTRVKRLTFEQSLERMSWPHEHERRLGAEATFRNVMTAIDAIHQLAAQPHQGKDALDAQNYLIHLRRALAVRRNKP